MSVQRHIGGRASLDKKIQKDSVGATGLWKHVAAIPLFRQFCTAFLSSKPYTAGEPAYSPFHRMRSILAYYPGFPYNVKRDIRRLPPNVNEVTMRRHAQLSYVVLLRVVLAIGSWEWVGG